MTSKAPKLGDRFWPQFVPSFIATLLNLVGGLGIGYTSPSISSITNELRLSEQQETFVGSMLILGAGAGSVFGGPIVKHLGRKGTIVLIIGPSLMLGFLAVCLSHSISLLLTGRFITGLGLGLGTVAVPLYCSECSTPTYRGRLGGLVPVMITSGIALAYSIGSFVEWRTLAWFCFALAPVSILAMIWQPESPTFLITQGKITVAHQSLRKLRGPEESEYELECEIKALELEIQEESSQTVTMSDLLSPSFVKPFLITAMTMVFQQLAAINVILLFVVDIFKSAGTNISEDLQTILLGWVLAMAHGLGTALSDRAGRRLLLLLSGSGIIVGLGSMGSYYYLKDHTEQNMDNLGWLPLVSLMVYIVPYSVGYGAIPWVLMGELFAPKYRAVASGICSGISWIMAFATTSTFKPLESGIGEAGTFWLYSSINIVGILLIFSMVPETKGKSLQEIEAYFKPTKAEEMEVVEMEEKFWPQFIPSFIATLLSLVGGLALGYSSPAISSIDAELNLTDEEETFVGTLVILGAGMGSVIGGPIVRYVGRKGAILYTIGPSLMLGFLAICLAHNVALLMSGRFVTGLGLGLGTVAVPLYCSEISTPKYRGTLGAMAPLMITAGIAVAYSIGAVLEWRNLSWTCLALTPISIIGMFWQPESPTFLVTQGKILEAQKSLRKLRGPDETDFEIQSEIRVLEMEIEANRVQPVTMSDLKSPGFLKPFFMTLLTMVFQQISGIYVILLYVVDIFESAGSSLSESIQTIIVGWVLTAAIVLGTALADKAGRRPLFLASGVGMALGMGAMGTYYYLKDETDYDSDALGMLPLVSLLVFVTFYSIGFGPMPWVVMGEVFAPRFRAVASGVCSALDWLTSFTVASTFNTLKSATGMAAAFWIYSAINVIGVILVYFLLAETKGKTLQEIEAYFKTTTKEQMEIVE
ncbi:unnamed protein product [Cyprideis torosa]|uniref:Uncharacterized protein n=1 Tax=Cyprideis torosa TaxID=163714 RepID=A0A7R8ZHN4_9CRUS|nr:unnamed protein product [Cyprideis torosa]CAG0884146.1 unnamed protein product [Cyprideis torosa]